ncbi:MAG: hypothetical protein EAZ83_31385 [Oscillatoriales cyanobacterium]|nr:MAG: hypothetical protein EAZ83_31385 [Oscillatoriales cyanobacterium]
MNKETGFLPALRVGTNDFCKKPGFWPLAIALRTKKPGFSPKLMVLTKYFRKKPVVVINKPHILAQTASQNRQ